MDASHVCGLRAIRRPRRRRVIYGGSTSSEVLPPPNVRPCMSRDYAVRRCRLRARTSAGSTITWTNHFGRMRVAPLVTHLPFFRKVMIRSARARRARANDLLQTALKLSTPERPARQGRNPQPRCSVGATASGWREVSPVRRPTVMRPTSASRGDGTATFRARSSSSSPLEVLPV